MGKYDYSKYKDEEWSADLLKQDFWGLHEIDGRIEVDVERFALACELATEPSYCPEELKKIGGYYIPSKINRHDYICNFLYDSLNALKKDWNEEYKPLFKSICSPKEVADNHRMTNMAMFGNKDTFDSIELGSQYAALQRIETYERIICELRCVFIIKVCTEINRIILRTLSMDLYENPNYSVRDLITYCNAKSNVSVENLKNWGIYTKFNNVQNFLKHNSRSAYEILKRYNKECLIEKPDTEYENGMFSYYWINFKEVDIDNYLEKVGVFLEDFCKKVLNEDVDRAKWDYDQFFLDTNNELKDPNEHFGINDSMGMSPLD